MKPSTSHCLSIASLGRAGIDAVLEQVEYMSTAIANGEQLRLLEGRLMACVFAEPSLRTQVSFEAAMLRLGGRVLGSGSNQGARANSCNEESLADAAQVMGSYADVIVFRHSAPDALLVYAESTRTTVINAGNGNGPNSEHPTQALTDLYTIKHVFGRLSDLNVALVGCLHKRAVRSLAAALSYFPNVRLLVPAASGSFGDGDARSLWRGCEVLHYDTVDEAMRAADVVYHGGLTPDWQLQLSEEHYLTASRLRRCLKHHAIVMHPMPRPGSIAVDVDSTPFARYFETSAHGVPVRMALLSHLLSVH